MIVLSDDKKCTTSESNSIKPANIICYLQVPPRRSGRDCNRLGSQNYDAWQSIIGGSVNAAGDPDINIRSRYGNAFAGVKAGVHVGEHEIQWEVQLPRLRLIAEHFRSQYRLSSSDAELSEDVKRASMLLEELASSHKSTDLSVAIEQQARRAVEERVVKQMLSDTASPLWTLNFIWVVQQACRQHGFRYGQPSSPTDDLDRLLDAMLGSVPWEKRDLILETSGEVCQRIYTGLAHFQFKSNLDTWRTRIVMRTLNTLRRRELRRLKVQVTFSSLAQPRDPYAPVGEESQLDPPSSDLTPEEVADRRELERVLRELSDLALSERPATAPVIELLLSGLRPREVARSLGVDASAVHQANHRWKKRMRELLSQHGIAYAKSPAQAKGHQHK